MSTHIEINYRAINWLNQTNTDNTSKLFSILNNHGGSWQAGSFFPDWGFGCKGFHEESEEAHWPPFHLKLIELIRTEFADKLYELQTTPLSELKKIRGNEEFLKILSFLFGLIGHSVADVLFHDLDHREQGLIRAFANINHYGDYYKTHQIADFGGELILSHRYKLDYYSNFWNTPTQNLIKVYRRMGYNKINSITLNSCMSLGYLAAKSNAQQGKLLFGKFDLDKSSIMIQEFEDYFKGGVYSMSFKVYECWLELIDILLNDKLINNFCKKIFPDYSSLRGNLIRTNTTTISWNDLRLLVAKDDNISSSSEDRDDNDKVNTITKACTKLNENKGLLRIRSIYGEKDYERFGTKLISGDFNNDGYKDLVISSPYHFNYKSSDTNQYSVGKLSIYSGGKNILKLKQSPKATLRSPLSFNSNSKFGESLAVLDFNGDGIDDLIVGIPNFEQSPELSDEYSGSILIYFGSSKNWDIINNQQPKVLPLPNTLKERNYTQFGTKLFSIDINGDGLKDLIIGLPFSTNTKGKKLQSGQICIYLNSPRKGIKNEPNWCLSSPFSKSYERFGYHIVQKILFDNRTSLLVGAPSYHSKDKTLMGRIYEIELNSEGYPIKDKQKVLLEGFNERMGIGRSFDIDKSYPSKFMLVAASSEDVSTSLITHWQGGKVYKFSFIQNQLELISKGFENGGQFGSEIKYNLQSDRWWITEPGRDEEKGGIYRINANNPSESNCLESNTKLGRFGTSMLLEDFDGDGIDDLVISEPYHSTYLDKESPPSNLRSEGRIQILFSVPKKLPLKFWDKYFYFKDFYYMGVSISFWSICLLGGLIISFYKLRFGGNNSIRVRDHIN